MYSTRMPVSAAANVIESRLSVRRARFITNIRSNC
jgi:hypothetical protein